MAAKHHTTRSDFYVYVLVRGDTGLPFYIGKGRRERWTDHESDARAGIKGHKCAIIRSLRARGLDVIKVKLHEGLTDAVAHAYEIAFIKAIGRRPNGPLVNLTDGGEGLTGASAETRAKMGGTKRGTKHSPEAIAKMSAIKLGKKMSPQARANMKASSVKRGAKPSAECIAAATAAKLGKKHSPERTAKHAATQRGRKHSDEHRAKIRAAHLGKKRSPEQCANIGAARRGKTFSAQHKANLSAVRRGKKQSPETKAKRKATWAAKRLAKAKVVTKQDSRQMIFLGL